MIYAFLVLVWTMHFALSLTQIRHINNLVKTEFDSPSREFADYELAKQKFSLFNGVFELVLSLFWLLFGFKLLSLFDASLLSQTLAVCGFLALNALLLLPFEYYSTFKIESKFDLNQTTKKTFCADFAKKSLLFVLFVPPLVAAFLAFFNNANPIWWVYASLACVGILLLLNALAPLFMALFFNQITPLQDAELNAKISRLFQTNNIPLSGVFVCDASKRSKKLNAYFSGVGKTRKVVLFDTLLTSLNHDQLLAVIAHELGHLKHHDIAKRVALVSLLIFASFACLANIPPSFLSSANLPSNATGVLLFLLVFASSFLSIFLPLLSVLSRKAEFGADEFSAKNGYAEALCQALEKLSEKNKSFAHSNEIYSWFYHSHPSVAQRISHLQRRR